MTITEVYTEPRIIEATADNLGLKQRLSIAESFEPNAFGKTPKVCVWDGSIRTGKTIASLLAWVIFVVNAPSGGELVVVGRTRESIARNVFGPLMDPELFGEFSQYIHYTAGAPTAKMFGRTIHVLGASDVRSEAVLRGLTVSGGYVDEGTLIAEPFWVQLLGRMSILGAQLFVTTNPDGPQHWFHKSVIKKFVELGYKRYHFTIQDAEYLIRTNPDFYDQLHREFTGLWKRRFLDGEWVQAEGAVYSEWDEAKHIIKPEDIPTIDRLFGVGLDFGTIHKTRAYTLGIGKDPFTGKDCLYTLDEFAPDIDLNVGKQSRLFQDWLASVKKRWKLDPEWIAVDGAAAHFRRQLFDDGITNIVAHKSVQSGIQTISALLGIEGLKVSTDCPHLIEHIPGYMWDPKATARGDEEPVKDDDDEVDGWRYSIFTFRRFWRGRVPVTPARDDAPNAPEDEAW